MALTKSTEWNGFEVANAYAKISKLEISDYMDEETKKWKANVYVGVFKDDTKANGLYGESKNFEGFTEIPTHETIYTKLKEEDFTNWLDA